MIKIDFAKLRVAGDVSVTMDIPKGPNVQYAIITQEGKMLPCPALLRRKRAADERKGK